MPNLRRRNFVFMFGPPWRCRILVLAADPPPKETSCLRPRTVGPLRPVAYMFGTEPKPPDRPSVQPSRAYSAALEPWRRFATGARTPLAAQGFTALLKGDR